MEPVQFRTASTDEELEAILALQRRNVEAALDPEDARRDGFVTLRHDLGLLREMNLAMPQVLATSATSDEAVVGYALALARELGARFPLLDPMFARLRRLEYRGRPVDERRYFVMGQVCVAEAYRGRGVFDGLYCHMRELYSGSHELVVTELASRNGRSARAHARVGFELLERYPDGAGEEWDLIAWDWTDRGPPSRLDGRSHVQ